MEKEKFTIPSKEAIDLVMRVTGTESLAIACIHAYKQSDEFKEKCRVGAMVDAALL